MQKIGAAHLVALAGMFADADLRRSIQRNRQSPAVMGPCRLLLWWLPMRLLYHLGALAALAHNVNAGREVFQSIAHLHAIHVIHIHGQCVVQLIDAHHFDAANLGGHP